MGQGGVPATLLHVDPFDLILFSDETGEVLASIPVSSVATVDPASLPRIVHDGAFPFSICNPIVEMSRRTNFSK